MFHAQALCEGHVHKHDDHYRMYLKIACLWSCFPDNFFFCLVCGAQKKIPPQLSLSVANVAYIRHLSLYTHAWGKK